MQDVKEAILHVPFVQKKNSKAECKIVAVKAINVCFFQATAH